MPNREYRAQCVRNGCWPSNWMNLSKEQQDGLTEKFTKLAENEKMLEEAVAQFKPSNWNQKNDDQRIGLCQSLENYLAYESGREPFHIVRSDDAACIGETMGDSKTIKINLGGHNSFEILETMVHESSHADQMDLFDKRTKTQSGQMSISDFKEELEKSGLSESELLVMNWEADHYMTPENSRKQSGSTDLYEMQLLETDAIFESAKFLRKYSSSMGNEDGFLAFLEEKEEEVEELKGLFKKEDTVKKWFEDRNTRVGETSEEKFSQSDREQLKSIFSAQDINECGFKLLTHLENWEKLPGPGSVRNVTLNELTGGYGAREPRGLKRPAETTPVKEKKAKFQYRI